MNGPYRTEQNQFLKKGTSQVCFSKCWDFLIFFSGKERPLSLVPTTCHENWLLVSRFCLQCHILTSCRFCIACLFGWSEYILNQPWQLIFMFWIWIAHFLVSYTYMIIKVPQSNFEFLCFYCAFFSAFNRSVWRWTNKSQWQAGVLIKRLALFLSPFTQLSMNTAV